MADRDRTVSRRSEPSSRTTLNGEQPYPWDRLQPQDEMSRHRGAKHRRRYELLGGIRSEEHTSELQSQSNLVCRLLLEKKKKTTYSPPPRWACTMHRAAPTALTHAPLSPPA